MDAEKTLIERVIAGDKAAFADIVRAHQASVKAFIGRYIRDYSVVDDIAQEAFVAMFHSLPTYRFDSSFRTWILGIARHHALRFLRSEGKRQKQRQEFLDAAVLDWHAADMEARDLADSGVDQQLLLLKRCINKLPDKHSALLKAHYFDEQASEQIARTLDKKAGTIRMALMRIREAIRQCIEQGLITLETQDA